MGLKPLLLVVASLAIATPATATSVYTSTASRSATGSIACRAFNVGSKELEAITVALFTLDDSPGGVVTLRTCSHLPPDGKCSVVLSAPGPAERFCRVDFPGSKRGVRASLTVQDANGGTILSLPAE